MKTFLKTFAATAVLAFVAATPTQARAQTVLRYSNFVPPGHPVRTQILDPWVANVERVTNGRVKFNMLPKVVGTVAGQYDVVRDGLADVAVVVPGYQPGKFVLTEIVEIPFIGELSQAVSPAMYKVYIRNFIARGEFAGTHLLSIFATSPQHLFTAKKTVKAVDDFKGMKLRTSTTSSAQAITQLGGVPVIKPVTEMYELVSGGIVDGALFNSSDHQNFKLTEVLPIATLIPGGFATTAVALVINEDKWQSIAKSDRDAIMSVSGEALARVAGKAYDSGTQQALEDFRKKGGRVETLSPAVGAELKAKLAPLDQAWIEKAKQKGVPDAAEALKALRAEVADGAAKLR